MSGGRVSLGVAEVVDDREQRAHGVHAQREPPDELLVKFLLEVLQHQQSDGEAGQSARNVRDVTDGRRAGRRLEGVPAVHGKPDVYAGCGQRNKAVNWSKTFSRLNT